MPSTREWIVLIAVAVAVLLATLLGVTAYKIGIGVGVAASAAALDKRRRDRAKREASRFRNLADDQFSQDEEDAARVAERIERVRETVRETRVPDNDDPLLNQDWLDRKDRGG